jgi:hypothetical protein
MRKTNLCILLVLVILTFSGAFSVLFIEAQSTLTTVNINADGSITPSITPMMRNGDVYTLRGNISGSLVIHKSNIIIDGAGFALNGNGGIGIDLQNNVTNVPSDKEIWNVTVKNLAVINFAFSVETNAGGNDTFLYDYIANNLSGLRGGIFLWGCVGNNITHCSISGSPAVFMDFCSNHNNITQNNLAGGVWLEMGGNEMVDSNYWTDYLTKYPTATEINSSGAGNIPYAFETYGDAVNGVLVDNHPQMRPFTIPTFADLPITLSKQQGTALDSQTPTPTAPSTSNPNPTPSAPEFLPMTALAVLIVASIAVTAICRKMKKYLG